MVRLPTLLIAVWCAVVAGSSSTHAGQPAQRAAAPVSPVSVSSQRALLDRYCVTCHNQRLKTAGLELDGLDVTNVRARADAWEKVIRKLRMGTMPPAGMPRPDQSASSALAAWLEGEIDRAAATRPNPGRTEAVHRLNRAEYQNAIRDLLAVEIDVASLLPADDADRHGFDNIADVLSVSPALLERYVVAARKIGRIAVGQAAPPLVRELYEVPIMRFQDDRMSEDLPFGSRGGVAIHHHFPADGEYSVKVRLLRTYVDCIKGMAEPHELEIRLDGVLVKQFTIGGESKGKPAPSSFCGNLFGDPEWEYYVHEADAGLEVRFPARAGTHTLGVAFVRELREPEGVLRPRLPTFAFAIDEQPDGLPAVDQVTVAGPHTAAGPGETPSRKKIFTCRPSTPVEESSCARAILSTVARRAYRRAVTDKDIRTLLSFYAAGRKQGSFETGVQAAIERILVAPDFLFRFEPDPKQLQPGTPYRLSDIELASRLSFFLWSSIPDDTLLDLAIQGKLRTPAVLDQQVRRMLADVRSRALIENFAGQWLELRNIRNVVPDHELFQDFDENLRESFLQETELFIESQIREDRGVPELLTANYTFLNERLARHYQIPNVYGSRFRLVTLEDKEKTAGLLSHGSLMTVTSYPNRTSPVLRGKWILNNMLGSPPPPPPPDIPGLPERGEGGKTATVRERLELHRKNPACASCHNQMDPLGFALENYDAIGRWRVSDAGAAIDASGALPGGSTFVGPTGLRDLLLSHREQFVGTLTEKLLVFALGRSTHHYDQPVVRAIVRDAASSGYRWSAIILGIVRSVPFQMRTSAGGSTPVTTSAHRN